MRRRVGSFKVWPVLISAGAAAMAMAPTPAKAQLDINPPLPNVMLLLDTSGSLERMTDRTELPTEGALDNCLAANYEKNRWATVVNALTGTVLNPSCEPPDRNDASFRFEYGTNVHGGEPYDFNYYLPFHRIASNGCVMSPDGSTYNAASWWDFPSGSVIETDASFGACGSTFQQDADGIIDTFGNRVRFGLMTFDPLTEPDTDEVGTYSYWFRSTGGDDWSANSQSTVGWPLACTTRLDMEVGARNPSAPPWEGRLMGFGDYDIDFATVQANNDNVQTAIMAMRPYGATPLAGMMNDVQEFLTNDDSTISPAGGPSHDPADVSQSLSAKDDPYWDFDPGSSYQCRKTFIVLLSDGEPNLDLRPDCDDPGGQDCSGVPGIPDGGLPNTFGCCPFDTPSNIAAELAQDTGANARDVNTYVIGLGLSQIDADVSVPTDGFDESVDCNDIIDDSLGPPAYLEGGTFQLGGVCNRTGVDDTVVGLEACCALSSVAFNGDTERAYFPASIDSLKSAFAQVLDDIASGSTGRTHPVFNNVRNRQWQDYDTVGTVNGYQVLSSLEAPLGQDLWRGNLQRKRYSCSGGVSSPTPLDIDESEGDDFGKNLNDNLAQRKYWTVNPDQDGSSTAYPQRSVRPFLAAADDDGMGVYDSSDTALDDISSHVGNVDSESLRLAPAGIFPSMCDNTLEASGNAALCKARLLEWNAGENVVLPSTTAYLRNDAFGAIYHSTPNIIGPPSALVRDESYSSYAETEAGMPTMLYTGTTDGQLHAFIVQLNKDPTGDNVPFLWPSEGGTDTEQNELWTFMPPMALSGLAGSFDQQSILLDGVPVIQDVVFARNQAGAVGGSATWNRVLLMAGGDTASSNGYYYALDVTNPRAPKFLWQLSTSDSDEPLFGKKTPTPAITNLAIDIAGTRTEVAVAILAGGSGSAVDPVTSCARAATGAVASAPAAPYTPRANVRCWQDTGGSASGSSGRSVTIVRLDTGEVLMSMRADAAEGPGGMTNCPASPCNVMDVEFDSPMTGEPVAFPGGVGAVASRVYVGDDDGTLWRIDLSDPDPQNWSVDIAWDTFYDQAFDGGHLIPNAPITSVDEVGDTVLLFATGDQEVFGYTAGQLQRVLSITDIPTGGAFAPMLNWQEDLPDGERVTGPMVLFDSIAYFATFEPNSAPTCEFGHAKVWGLHYRNAEPLTTPPEGLASFDATPLVVDPDVKFIDEADGTIVFGLAAIQVPSCSSSANVFDYFNPESRLSGVDEGVFQLVYSTGKGGTAAQTGDKTNSMTFNLKQPDPFLRIDSYAAIIE